MDEETFGLVVAGGRSQRMGQDKATLQLGGRPLLERAAARLTPHCRRVGVSVREAGPADAIIARLGLARITDRPGAEGPLQGVHAGLAWAREAGASRIVTLPCDLPFPPSDLVERLLAAAGEEGCAVARTPGGLQSLCAVWGVRQIPMLEEALAGGRHPSVREPLFAAGCAVVAFEDEAAFLNLNTPQDLAAAQARLAADG